jgi:hypothetical protein
MLSVNLLRDVLSVGWGKNVELGCSAKERWKIIEQGGDSVG